MCSIHIGSSMRNDFARGVSVFTATTVPICQRPGARCGIGVRSSAPLIVPR
jgi:hypothetical protein